MATCPYSCSGAMNPSVPIILPVSVRVTESATDTMPKSMSLGPSGASRTFCGLTSRCTTPAAWISASASARPAASVRQCASGIGPRSRTPSASDSPGMYSVARYGVGASGSASSTRATCLPRTWRAASTSRRKRARSCEFATYSGTYQLDRGELRGRAHPQVHDTHAAAAQPAQQLPRAGAPRLVRQQSRPGRPPPLHRRHQPSSSRRSSSMPKWCATSCTTVIRTSSTTSSSLTHMVQMGRR